MEANILPTPSQPEFPETQRSPETPNASAPEFNIFPELQADVIYSLKELCEKIRGIYTERALKEEIKRGALRAFGSGRRCQVIGGHFLSFFWGTQKTPNAANENAAPFRRAVSRRSSANRNEIEITIERKETVNLNFFEQNKSVPKKKPPK